MTIYPKLNKFFTTAKSVDNPDYKCRDTYNFYSYLKTILQINSRLMGHFITRTTALTSFDWAINGEDKNLTEAVKLRLDNLIVSIISNHAYAALFGSNLYQLELSNNEYGSQLKLAKTIDQMYYDYDFPNVYLKDINGLVTETINLYDNQYWVLDYVPYYAKGGILRTIMPSEIIRFDMVLENANWLRKLKGILQVINKNASAQEQAAAEQAAQSAIQENYLVTSDLIEFKLNQIAGQGGASFKDFIDSIDRSIAIAILGQANTSELPNSGGSRAALQVLKMISADIAYSDIIRVENLINKILLLDYKMNIKADAISTPYFFSFNIAEEEDILKNADAVQTLKNAGIPLSKKEVYQKIGFTEPLPGEEVI